MNTSASVCPKCGGEMCQGFILDLAHGAQRVVSQWVPGVPEKSFWMTTKLPDEGLVPVAAFRCGGCGFLEHYARDEFAAK